MERQKKIDRINAPTDTHNLYLTCEYWSSKIAVLSHLANAS